MLRACVVCGAISREVRCPRHRYTRNRAKQQAFADAVKARAGGRCERCGSTDRLQAHHITPLHQGGSDRPDNGVLLCIDCHKRVDRYAR